MILSALKKNTIMKGWLLSYVTILLIPIIVGLLIYLESTKVLSNEINRSNQSLLTQIQSGVDSRLAEMDKFSVDLAINKKLENLYTTQNPLTNDERYKMFELMRDLQTTKFGNDFIDYVFVYFHSIDMIVSESNAQQSHFLFDLLKPDNHMDWASLLKERYINTYFALEQEMDNKGKSVMYVRTLVPNYPDRPGASVMFMFNTSKLLNTIKHVPLMKDGHILILNAKHEVITSTSSVIPNYASWLPKFTGVSGVIQESDEGRELAISYVTSGQSGWQYIFITPQDVFLKKLIYIKRITYLCVAFCLLLGGVAAYFFLRRNYSPIQLLLNKVNHQKADPHNITYNEYHYIQNALESLIQEKDHFKHKLKEQHPAMRNHLFGQLLKGRMKRTLPLSDVFAAYDVSFPHERFGVLMIYIDNYGKLDSPADDESHYERVKLLHFMIMNVVEELANKNNVAYMVEMDEYLCCILNGSDHSATLDEWKSIAKQTQEFLLTHVQVAVTVSISSIQQSLFGLQEAYEEAMEAMEYKFLMGGGEILVYDEMVQGVSEDHRPTYYYPLAAEQQLINFIKTGDAEKAMAVTKDIISTNITRSQVSIPFIRCIVVEFASTFMKAMIELPGRNEQDSLSFEQVHNQLLQCRSIKELEEELAKIIKLLCHSEKQSGVNNELMEKVQAYVNQYYCDPNLNVSVIGAAFDLTPPYLARLFKNYNGESLLEYLQKIRIAHAKRLLKETSSSVLEIGNQVGFNEISTFNRIFKKFEGITAGKFRDLSKS
ncbi:Helix-turn-helix domain-containing protein [Paenibacillus sp. 1_12]|uniref:AraC family transcriptional regulator n=1 Tax=Paenibacillus sp. 1_12 TaxID=1566278 RepID=UPI0008E4583C|nr:AraC family transcriptional regulator [Paenibacillus sp. 1_12]SFL59314.1 Helix-turn-helix domain-containing protein [Paenibacillus sp. 1_12]